MDMLSSQGILTPNDLISYTQVLLSQRATFEVKQGVNTFVYIPLCVAVYLFLLMRKTHPFKITSQSQPQLNVDSILSWREPWISCNSFRSPRGFSSDIFIDSFCWRAYGRLSSKAPYRVFIRNLYGFYLKISGWLPKGATHTVF